MVPTWRQCCDLQALTDVECLERSRRDKHPQLHSETLQRLMLWRVSTTSTRLKLLYFLESLVLLFPVASFVSARHAMPYRISLPSPDPFFSLTNPLIYLSEPVRDPHYDAGVVSSPSSSSYQLRSSNLPRFPTLVD